MLSVYRMNAVFMPPLPIKTTSGSESQSPSGIKPSDALSLLAPPVCGESKGPDGSPGSLVSSRQFREWLWLSAPHWALLNSFL